jgi:hypothetical protein
MGPPVYCGLSGSVHFRHGGLAPLAFLLGFVGVPFILARLLR